MATYAQNALTRERAEQRRTQDQIMAHRHRAFDLSSQDTHHKYERPQFVVVTASDAFRAGYEAISWRS